MSETRKFFIFIDRVADEKKHELAESEIHARMKLGGKWDDTEHTTAYPPREIAELPDLIKAALDIERAAHDAMVAAKPPEASSLKARYERRAAERREVKKFLRKITEEADRQRTS
jgi:hypothetical protein